jgi:hypothetical protein
MREYSIVLPTHDNDGTCLATLHNRLKRELIYVFEGYSATAQTGGWVNDKGQMFEEPSIRYTVASTSESKGLTTDIIVSRIARKYGILAGQQAMYVVLDGTVEIITIGA